jgi:predicted phosphoribosyltransferase
MTLVTESKLSYIVYILCIALHTHFYNTAKSRIYHHSRMSTISEENNNMIQINSENNSNARALFLDRIEAANILTEKLRSLVEKELRGEKDNQRQLIILAIPRGGVVTGDVIASILNAELDIVVSRKVASPYNSELAIGAVMHDGTFFPNIDIIKMLGVSQEYIDEQISAQTKEIERRLRRFRAAKGHHYSIQGKTIVLSDDGIATGATIFAAIEWIKRQNPKELIVAVPVAPRHTVEKLRQIVDKVVVLHAPVLFEAVGAFYQDFSQVSDDEVVDIMSKYAR